MNAGSQTEKDSEDSPKGTLGALLYPDKTREPVPEKVWLNLVAAIADSDQTALHLLYERTHCLVFTLVVRICKSREIAEELTVDVFYDVWRGASGYDPEQASVVGWVMNLARSRALARAAIENQRQSAESIGTRFRSGVNKLWKTIDVANP